ncbi:NAD(P)-dependent alcohol dehydrogenase [Rubellicoccus peritrichatus]|uniref:NAD(P)-dependent alcohol dehydrogenase n=1 Tax=Rubellicoccus peritrichatus TaxID=3080537 RepID=A0AAQ3L9A7_9BACT|nr:NAD(P)-dependent alcohol dehydrogenase [Puniceicoccus sp. CR14]WOO40299.1 NAD(P)-dependent alcohol dehydrogenase [Puniceicoccus sp. CR14]
MKAITYSCYGPPNVLKVKDVEKPVPKDDEILIKVQAVEVTKADCEMRSFKFPVKWFWLPLRCAFGLRKPKRQILGSYFSGEIVSMGKDVLNLSAGDEVFGAAQLRLGAYGEFVSLPASYTIVRKPENMNFEEAACVPLGGLNALHFMRLANIQKGERILINGAGGSIGAHAVQIAKSLGAEVTAVDKAIKKDFLLRMGVDAFIDYTKEDFSNGDKTYDVLFDMVPRSAYSKCINVLTPNGRYLSGNPNLAVMLRSFFTSRFTNKTARFAFAKETREELLTLKQMIEDGSIKPIVDRVYTMQAAPEAHHRVETEERTGAIVIKIGDRQSD